MLGIFNKLFICLPNVDLSENVQISSVTSPRKGGFVRTPRTPPGDALDPLLSLMSAQDVEKFKQAVRSEPSLVSLISDKFCKSMYEANRYALYESIKDRRMVAHVNSLPLPKPVKKYLCLEYEMSEKFRMLSAKEENINEEQSEMRREKQTKEKDEQQENNEEQ